MIVVVLEFLVPPPLAVVVQLSFLTFVQHHPHHVTYQDFHL